MMKKAMKETVLIRLNMSNAIFDKTNLMFSVLVLFSLNILWTLFAFNITCYTAQKIKFFINVIFKTSFFCAVLCIFIFILFATFKNLVLSWEGVLIKWGGTGGGLTLWKILYLGVMLINGNGWWKFRKIAIVPPASLIPSPSIRSPRVYAFIMKTLRKKFWKTCSFIYFLHWVLKRSFWVQTVFTPNSDLEERV